MGNLVVVKNSNRFLARVEDKNDVMKTLLLTGKSPVMHKANGGALEEGPDDAETGEDYADSNINEYTEDSNNYSIDSAAYEEYLLQEKKKNHKKKKKDKYRSSLMRGERLTESQVIERLKQDKVPYFQVRNKEELEKCSPLYYCSNKFMDQVCKPEPMFQPPCRVKLSANGGDRDMLGPGQVMGTCEIHYTGCDPSTFDTTPANTPQPSENTKDTDSIINKPTENTGSNVNSKNSTEIVAMDEGKKKSSEILENPDIEAGGYQKQAVGKPAADNNGKNAGVKDKTDGDQNSTKKLPSKMHVKPKFPVIHQNRTSITKFKGRPHIKELIK